MRSGDRIRLDVEERELVLLVDDAEMARRRAAKPVTPPTAPRGYRKLFHDAVTQADLDQLRVFQREVQSNHVIIEYARAQQDAIAYLREINQEIGELLGVDFAALAGRSSC